MRKRAKELEMEETIHKNAAKAASAQKPQQNELARAAAIISRNLPDFLQPLANALLKGGIARPQDFTGETPRRANEPKQKQSRRRGRPRNGIRPFPTSFPVGSGITWDNLYDARTEKILSGVARYMAESRLFGADLEDKVTVVREEIPFSLQRFRPVPGKPDARYDFTAHAAYNTAKNLIRQRLREIEQGMPTISLEENLNAEGELTLKDTLSCEDTALRRDEAIDTLRLVFPQLEEQDQAIVFLSSWLELSISQIADRIGMSPNNVHYRLNTVIPRTAKEIVERDLGGAR